MRRYLIGLILLVMVGLIFTWSSLIPTISKDDIVLTGELQQEQLSPEPKLPTRGGHVVEILLSKKTDKPIAISDRAYFSMVYIFVDGFTPCVWDFYKGIDQQGRAIGSDGFSFGSDSMTISIAAKSLKDIGYVSGDSLKDINELNKHTVGFTYAGNTFPVRVRIYLCPIDKSINKDQKAYLVYTHYEKKWGKDLSWAKVVPIRIQGD